MRFGVTMFTTDRSMRPDDLAVAVEERGMSSVWFPEHTHIPTVRATPPPTGDAELPDEYRRTLDPWVACTAAALATTTLRVGSGVALVAQRDPIVDAKAISTIDHLSGGRITVGVGFGWNREELASHGVRFDERHATVADRIGLMRALWSDDVGAHEGPHARIEPSWQWPKPSQHRSDGTRGVPVYLGGGTGPRLADHLVDWADGWIPIGAAGLTEALPRLRQRLTDAGRDPARFDVIPFGTVPTAEKLEHLVGLGITEVVFRVPSAGRDIVLPVLDAQADLIARQ